MNGWIGKQIDKATWMKFGVWFAVLFIFSVWAFNMDSPYTRALAAGGGMLPETQPGFPAIEPQRSLALLGNAKNDYILWQAIDVPYAIMNLMLTMSAIGLGLKALHLGASALRFLLFLPLVYVACEIIENSLVALFASAAFAPVEPLVLVQQSATTIKFASGFGVLGFGLAGVVIALFGNLLRLFRKSA